MVGVREIRTVRELRNTQGDVWVSVELEPGDHTLIRCNKRSLLETLRACGHTHVVIEIESDRDIVFHRAAEPEEVDA